MSLQLPADFRQSMSKILADDQLANFTTALETSPPVSIQLHPEKATTPLSNGEQTPWYERGRYLNERPVFTLDPHFQAGAYYVQEASSMFINQLAKTHLPTDRPWKILDLCAAPGGKSCLLAAIAPAGSLLVSNEVIKSRYGILKYNLAKWGMDNCWSTNLDPERFSALESFFDLVVVDAPCSGEGMFRKDHAAATEWSLENVGLCAVRQQRILRAAAPLVAEQGLLIYSTCTYNFKENEQQAQYLEQTGNFEILQSDFPQDWQITPGQPGYRFYPHKTKGEGFYAFAARKTTAAVIKRRKTKKPGHWTLLKDKDCSLPKSLLEFPENYQFYQDKSGMIHAVNKDWITSMEEMVAALGRLDMGFPVGTIKGKQIIPAAELALHTARKKALPTYEVDLQTALQLLKKETPPLVDLERGWQLITYQGNGLLWVKGLGNRYNNYYPAGWRIRMAL